jgi:tryptophan-rich sensory protein
MRYEMGPEGIVEVPSRAHSTGGHVLLGLLLAGGAVAAAELISRRGRAPVDDPDMMTAYAELQAPPAGPRHAAFAVIWPSMFMALTLSGLRVWNAQPGPSRTRALTLWGLVQGFSAVWMALGPRRVGGRVAAAVASLGAGAVYAWHASKVQSATASVLVPTSGWMGFAGLVHEAWSGRRPPADHTVH